MIRCRLQQMLDETDTSQRALARMIGASPTTINRLANDDLTRVHMPTVEKILEAFGVKIENFFYATQEAYEEKTTNDSQKTKQ